MLSTLSLIAVANASEPLPLPESDPSRYEEVTAFLASTAERAKELMGQAMPLIDRREWGYESLSQLNVAHFLPPHTEFPGHLQYGKWVVYPNTVYGHKENTVEWTSPHLAPYGNPVHHDRLTSFQHADDDWSYCYGGIRRFSNPGRTYDVETVEVENIRAGMRGELRDPHSDHAHPVESNCVTVRIGKWSTDPIRPLGKRADQIRAQYGEFSALPYKDNGKFFEYKLKDEKILRSTDKCELGGYDGFTYEGRWLKPELGMKEDWEDRAEDLCDFMAGYQTPPEK